MTTVSSSALKAFLSSRQPLSRMFNVNSIRNVRLSSSSAIDRIQLQNKIKCNDQICDEQMESGQYLLFHRGNPLLVKDQDGKFFKEPVVASFAKASEIQPLVKNDSVFLRVSPESGKPLFATKVPDDVDAASIENTYGGSFVNMRIAMFSVDEDRWSKHLCQAHSLLRWHQTTKFCSSCGHTMARNSSGSQRKCSSCETVQYPVTSPVAIVLLTTPDHSKVALIRQPTYPTGMFSCIAGFVDAGETLFDCVQREVGEEVSVEIIESRGIQLMNSQFWPFPSGSLMMACMAYIDPQANLKPCMEEVEQARWFTPEEISEALERVRKNPFLRLKNKDPDVIFVPPKGAIANFLLRTWLQKFAKHS